MDSERPYAALRLYAAERWAEVVCLVVTRDRDTRTTHDWGRLVGASRGTLGVWCRAARTSPRRSLDLGRLLYGLRVTGGDLTDIRNALDIVEERTVARLLDRSGLSRATLPAPLALSDVLSHQLLILDPRAVAALRNRLRASATERDLAVGLPPIAVRSDGAI